MSDIHRGDSDYVYVVAFGSDDVLPHGSPHIQWRIEKFGSGIFVADEDTPNGWLVSDPDLIIGIPNVDTPQPIVTVPMDAEITTYYLNFWVWASVNAEEDEDTWKPYRQSFGVLEYDGPPISPPPPESPPPSPESPPPPPPEPCGDCFYGTEQEAREKAAREGLTVEGPYVSQEECALACCGEVSPPVSPPASPPPPVSPPPVSPPPEPPPSPPESPPPSPPEGEGIHGFCHIQAYNCGQEIGEGSFEVLDASNIPWSECVALANETDNEDIVGTHGTIDWTPDDPESEFGPQSSTYDRCPPESPPPPPP